MPLVCSGGQTACFCQLIKEVESLFSSGTHSTLFSIYRVPDFLLFCLKRSQVDIHLHFEFALEITWYPPRVPAHRTSTILEFAPGENSCFFVQDLELWLGSPLSILFDAANIFFPRLSLNFDANRNLAIVDFHRISAH